MSKHAWILSLGLILLSQPCVAEDDEILEIELANTIAASEQMAVEIDDDMIDELLALDFDDDDDDDDLSDAVVFGDDAFDDEEEFS